MKAIRPVSAMLLLVVALLGGCSEEFPPAHNASISGSAMDSQGNPLGEIQIGALFFFRTPSAPSGVLQPAAGGIRLLAPYPNPNTAAVEGDVTITVECDADTTGRLEIYGSSAGVRIVIATLKTGGFAAGSHTVAWDGVNRTLQIPVSYVPNGLYEVRLTVPENPPAGTTPLVLTQNLLVNRPSGLMFPEAYNYQTAPDGYFLLEDLAIGEPFTMTSASGSVMGAREVSDIVTVYFRDPHFEYRDTQKSVTLGPRDQVTLDILMESNFPSAGGLLARQGAR